ncbi:MAG: HEAT repeat domain-containing protein [Phycisphaerales bacterium]|nr:HEAT repeat domain-containing protein [Phycisphaerales bacterium]
MMITINRFFTTLLTIVLVTFTTFSAAQEVDTDSYLDDFIHYALIANVDLAEANAIALLRSELSDEDFYKLVNETKQRQDRFDRAIGWALYVERLQPLAAELEDRVETGRINLIRNPEQLAQAIDLLSGTTRQRLMAEDRLIAAGEYAVPPLLRTMFDSPDARTTRMVSKMLTAIGGDAVLPLSVALPHLNSESQVVVCRVLGNIGYAHAAPALLSLLQNENASPAVAQSAVKALTAIGIDSESNLSTLQTVVAGQFFDDQVSVMPEAIAGINNFWVWDNMYGLETRDVPEAVFGDVMAMYFAASALETDPTNEPAMSIFVASNLRRDRDLAGVDDLVYGNLAYSPEFYATVFGPEIARDVLSIALDRNDTLLARDAIAALARTAGAVAAVTGSDQPLVRAMFYPDRRVQYESAITIASTLPKMSFEGSYRVVPLLASAVRSGDAMYAIIIGEDEEVRRRLATSLEAMGWSIMGEGTNPTNAIESAGIIPGIDLAVVIARSPDNGQIVANELALLRDTTATPVLVLADGADVQVLRNVFENQNMVSAAHVVVSDAALSSVLEDLLSKAAGGRLDVAEAEFFSAKALAVLRDIALANTVLQVDDATGALVDALATSDPITQGLVAETLSMVNTRLAQQTLVSAALSEGPMDDRIMLLDEAAASVRRWGNLTKEWQVAEIINLVETASGDLSDAAARLNGAINHPDTSVMIFMP